MLTSYFSESPFRVIGIGASDGGIPALYTLLNALPADFPVAILIAQHLSSKYPSVLNELLSRHTALRVSWAEEGMIMRAGSVYIAPQNRHLTVAPDGRLVLIDSIRINYYRPAVDLLFASMATSFAHQAIAVQLTGQLEDGKLGVQMIKAMGGRVIVQDPITADANSMPRAAIRAQAVDFVLPLDCIAPALITLTMKRGAESLFRVPRIPPVFMEQYS